MGSRVKVARELRSSANTAGFPPPTAFRDAKFARDGVSEINLGKLLKKLKPKAIIGTKVRVLVGDRGNIAGRINASLDESLKRFQCWRSWPARGRPGSSYVR